MLAGPRDTALHLVVEVVNQPEGARGGHSCRANDQGMTSGITTNTTYSDYGERGRVFYRQKEIIYSNISCHILK